MSSLIGIAVGDWDWLSHASCQQVTRTGLTPIASEPTRGCSRLDRVYVSDLHYSGVKVIKSAAKSDHMAIVAYWRCQKYSRQNKAYISARSGNTVVEHAHFLPIVLRNRCMNSTTVELHRRSEEEFDNFYNVLSQLMDKYYLAFDRHWILFRSMKHLPRLSQGRTRGKQNVVRKRSFAHEYCWKVTRHRYTAIAQWRIHNFIMVGGGRSMGGILGPLPEKKEFSPENGAFWCILRWLFTFMQKLVRSMGGRPPPPGSATAIFQKWFKIDGYMLRGVWQALNSFSINVTFTAMVPEA